MKKRYFIIIAFAFLAGITTSCMKMPESKGIDEAYAARVDFIKAQTIFKNAEIKLMEAKVLTENALTMQMEANVKGEEIFNQMKQATNEKDKVKFDLELKELQANNLLSLLYVQKSLATAQQQYQLSLAQLELAKKDIPAQYQNQLSELKSKLTDLADLIAQGQSDLIARNLTLNAYIANNSKQILSDLTVNFTNSQRSLQQATDNLILAKAAKGASGTSLETTKTSVKTKIDALSAELELNSIKLNALQFECNKTYEDYTKVNYQYDRADYKADIAIPNAVQTIFMAYFNSNLRADNRNQITTDAATYSCIGQLGNLIFQLQKVLSYVESKATANPTVPEWITLKNSIKSKFDSYTKVQNDLEFNQVNLYSVLMAKDNEYITVNHYCSTIRSSISQLGNLYRVLDSDLSGLDQAIATAEKAATNARASYNEAKVNLDTFKTNGAQDINGWAYSQTKVLRDSINRLTKNIADQQVEFDMVSKRMNALIALINS